MANVKRLFAERSLIEAKLTKIQQQLVRDSTAQPSLARVKLYQRELQFLYKQYQRVNGEILSAVPVDRYSDVDEDYERFDDLHDDACLLVETLLHSFPSTSDRYQMYHSPSSNYFAATTAPRWRTPLIRSRSPSPPPEQSVPIPDVMEKPNTSPPRELSPEQLFPDQANELKVSHFAINPIHSVQPPSAETSAMKLNPVCGAALVHSEGDLAEVIKSKSAPTPIVLPSVAPIAQKCHREEEATQREKVSTQRAGVPIQQGEVLTQCELPKLPTHEDSTHRGKVPKRCVEVTTVAYQHKSNPPSKQSEHQANPANPTLAADFNVGNETTKFVDIESNIPSCESYQPYDDDPAAVHQATNTFPIPINHVGIHPRPTPFERVTGFGALPKTFLVPPGFHPTPRLAPMPTEVLPVPKPLQHSAVSTFQCASGSRPVLQRIPCVTGFRSINKEFPSATGLCLVVKRFPCRTRFRPASKQSSRLTGSHRTPQRFTCVAGSIPALKFSSSLTGSISVVQPFQRVARFQSVSKHPSFVTEFCVNSDQHLNVAGFLPVLKQPYTVTRCQPMSQRFPAVSKFQLVPKQFPCIVGTHPIPEKPPDSTGIPLPVSKQLRSPTEMLPVLKTFLLLTGIPPVTQLAPASIKPNRMSAGIPPMIKPIPKMNEMYPAKQSCPESTGSHPVSKWFQHSTTIPPISMSIPTTAGIRPVRETILMPTRLRPVLREALYQRSIEMMPPVKPTSGSSTPISTQGRRNHQMNPPCNVESAKQSPSAYSVCIHPSNREIIQSIVTEDREQEVPLNEYVSNKVFKQHQPSDASQSSKHSATIKSSAEIHPRISQRCLCQQFNTSSFNQQDSILPIEDNINLSLQEIVDTRSQPGGECSVPTSQNSVREMLAAGSSGIFHHQHPCIVLPGLQHQNRERKIPQRTICVPFLFI